MGDPVVGSILGGKYQVEGILGQGGMGVVVAARHIELDQKVAIKCLLAHAQSVPEIVERFTREARAAAKIHGEHVARVIDVGRFDDGTPFMVMEHLRGHDLADELANKGPLPVVDAVRYILETCEALAQAHVARIVHRDLKPSKLFLAETPGRRPVVKVLDFGISKVIDPSGGALTKTASIMGTPYYMSPEQLQSSKTVDGRSDIWALGIILYELLVGRPPFVAETAPEIVAQVLQNQPEPITTYRQDVPQGILDAVARCLRSKAPERFANVADFSAAVVPFAAPEDRGSALAIARVLGVTTTPMPSSHDMSQAATHAPTISANSANFAGPPAGAPRRPARRTTWPSRRRRRRRALASRSAPSRPWRAAWRPSRRSPSRASSRCGVLRRPPRWARRPPRTWCRPRPRSHNRRRLRRPRWASPRSILRRPPDSAAASSAAAATAVAGPASNPAHGTAAPKHPAAAAPAAAAPAAPAHPAAAPAAPAAAAPPPASNPLDMHIK